MENADLLIPSNRFRAWVQTVPEDMRRWAYSAWREHIKRKIEKKIRGDDVLREPNQQEFDTEFANWENTQLRGVEARRAIEQRLNQAQEHFDEWLYKASEGKVLKKDVLYAALIGSSYMLPRSADDSDIDIGVILKKGTRVPQELRATRGFAGWEPVRTQVSSPTYTGNVDFFFHDADVGNIFFVISPHCPFYKAREFSDQTLKELVQTETDIVRGDFASIRGEGKSQEELQQIVAAMMKDLEMAIAKIKSTES